MLVKKTYMRIIAWSKSI